MRNSYAYWITGILGLLFILAPFVLGYSFNTAALWTSIAAGVLVLIMSALEALNHERETWEYWIAGIVGILAIISPFVLGFTNHAGAMWTSIVLGALIVITAGSKVYRRGPT